MRTFAVIYIYCSDKHWHRRVVFILAPSWWHLPSETNKCISLLGSVVPTLWGGTIWKASSPVSIIQFHNCFNVPFVAGDANLEQAATILSCKQGWELCFVIVSESVMIFYFLNNIRFYTMQTMEAWEVWMAIVQHPGPLEEIYFDTGQFLFWVKCFLNKIILSWAVCCCTMRSRALQMGCFWKQQPCGLLAQERAVTGVDFPGLHKALQICEPAELSSTLLGFVLSQGQVCYSYFPPHLYREL